MEFAAHPSVLEKVESGLYPEKDKHAVYADFYQVSIIIMRAHVLSWFVRSKLQFTKTEIKKNKIKNVKIQQKQRVYS